MSWSLNVIPLSVAADNEVLEWAAAASFSRGLPDQRPGSMPLPSAREILSAFQVAGCHGTAWFSLGDADATARLEECPNPSACSSAGGRDLGEVSLRTVGQGEHDQVLGMNSPIEVISFRKPDAAAVLTAVSVLALSAGPQLVFDDSADTVFVVWPGERADDLVTEWPW